MRKVDLRETEVDQQGTEAVVDEVRKTRQSQTVRLANGVVAVIKPERKPAAHRAKRTRAAGKEPALKYPTIASLAGAAGSLPRPLSWQEIHEIAWEDHVLEKLGRAK